MFSSRACKWPQIKPSANPQYIRRRLNEETVATKANPASWKGFPRSASKKLDFRSVLRAMTRLNPSISIIASGRTCVVGSMEGGCSLGGVASQAVDLIRRYVPLKADFGDLRLFGFLLFSTVPGQADRALPGDLMRSMQRCYWSCIQQARHFLPWEASVSSGFGQAPLVFRPVMTPGAWGNIVCSFECCPK